MSESVYEEHVARLMRHAVYRLGRLQDAEDAVQDAFVRMLEQGIAPEQGTAWLNRVLDNLCYDVMRSRYRLARRIANMEVMEVAVAAPEPTGIDDWELIEQTLTRLSIEQQWCWVLDAIGYGGAEVAEMLGMEPAKARKRLWEARKLAAGKPTWYRRQTA